MFVGSILSFEGYTDGRHKDVIDGLLSSGDVGHFDDEGRLFIDGRDDDMIVSGGENVFPGEVENLLLEHDGVAEVAVTGVPDDEFGQRLKAYVVTRPGAEPRRRRGPRRTCGPTSPATRCRATSCSSTSCRATPPARCSRTSSPSWADSPLSHEFRRSKTP